MKIRNKLLLAFIVVTSFSLALLTLIATDNAIKTIYQQEESTLNIIAEQKLESIYDYIDKKEILAATEAGFSHVLNAMEEFTFAYERGVESEIYAVKDTYYRATFEGVKNNLGSYDVFLISPAGDIVYTALHESDFATNLRTGPYKESQLAKAFDKAATLLETNFSHFEEYLPSSPIKGKNINQQVKLQSAFIATPLFKGNDLVGVMAFQLNSDDFFHLSADYMGLKNTGEIAIAQKNKQNIEIISPLRHMGNKEFNILIPIGSNIALPAQESVQGNNGSGLSISYEGTKVVAAWRHVPELGWGVVVKIEAEEAFLAASRLEQQLLITGGIILLGTVFIAVFISHHLTSSIITLATATKEIAEGDLSKQVRVNSKDEIGDLAIAFDKMRTALNSKIVDLKLNNQALEKSNKELDDFAYVASHDLKSPLRGLDQLAVWIREDIDDKEETSQHLIMMRSRILRMEMLLDDLLAYSQVGKIEEKIKAVNTRSVMESIFEMATPPSDFKLRLEGDFPRFYTVGVAFELVFRNLISNAIKHHDKKNGVLTISVKVEEEYFIYRVQDDGPGIAPQFHKKIFYLFQTLKSRDEVEGSGMGLAIIKKTINIYGGKIMVESIKEGGVCFIVFWPKKIIKNDTTQSILL